MTVSVSSVLLLGWRQAIGLCICTQQQGTAENKWGRGEEMKLHFSVSPFNFFIFSSLCARWKKVSPIWLLPAFLQGGFTLHGVYIMPGGKGAPNHCHRLSQMASPEMPGMSTEMTGPACFLSLLYCALSLLKSLSLSPPPRPRHVENTHSPPHPSARLNMLRLQVGRFPQAPPRN